MPTGKGKTHIEIRLETRARLKKHVVLKGETYDSLINKLLDMLEVK